VAGVADGLAGWSGDDEVDGFEVTGAYLLHVAVPDDLGPACGQHLAAPRVGLDLPGHVEAERLGGQVEATEPGEEATSRAHSLLTR